MRVVWLKGRPLAAVLACLAFSFLFLWMYLNNQHASKHHVKSELKYSQQHVESPPPPPLSEQHPNVEAHPQGDDDVGKAAEAIAHPAAASSVRERIWSNEDALLKEAQNILQKSPDEIRQEIAGEKAKILEDVKLNEDAEKLAIVNEPVLRPVNRDPPREARVAEQQDFIRKMMVHAWSGYKAHAWGMNEVRPVSKKGHSSGIFGSGPMGASIIDATDTLFVMGLDDQYQEARDWIALHFDFQPKGDVSVFETNIRFVGGLLSAYALTGDKMFRLKAEDVARKLLPAFNTPFGIPKSLLNIKTSATKNYNWASAGSSILSEIGTLQLEFDYLSHVSGDPIFSQKVKAINEHLYSQRPSSGLYPNYINPTTGKWGVQHVSVGALGDSFYEYLLKGWLLHGKSSSRQREWYDKSAQAMRDKMVQQKEGLTYVAEMKSNRLMHKMDHLACFSGGMFALGGHSGAHGDSEAANRAFLQLGAEITATCRQAYTRTATRIGPEAFHFESGAVASALRSNEKVYLLRPEVIESYFVLWRLTHEQKYRDWGWEAAQAIEQHCRKEGGYSGLRDVTNVNSAADDVQQSFFLAETLKYLYLLFSEDDLLPLDSWVFNTEAHPLPVIEDSGAAAASG